MDAPIQITIVAASDLDTRLDWVEPVVKSMMFGETANGAGAGPDGFFPPGPNCTLS